MSPTNIATWSKGMTPKSDTHLDDCASFSCSDDYVDADALNKELSIICENLLDK